MDFIFQPICNLCQQVYITCWSNKPQWPSVVMGPLCCRNLHLSDETLNRGFTVVIIDPITLIEKSRGFPSGLAKFHTSQPATLSSPDYLANNCLLSLHLSWVFWCKRASIASPWWMLYIGGGWGVFPPHHCKALGERHYINAYDYYYLLLCTYSINIVAKCFVGTLSIR